ncbi:hypothetical protein OKW43_005799 [Paraburkholderia sp. WC7.3g]|uniref:DUF2442 domain-containing protein n=1 Tax=Paraburkholderia TaxID=1822464 RepID=UPI001655BF35|nr:DUF2442 domain-containing protein [Paraburkholderia podalyriae]
MLHRRDDLSAASTDKRKSRRCAFRHTRQRNWFLAIEATFDESGFTVRLGASSVLHVLMEWFKKLKVTTPEQRSDVRISASGAGLHWDQLDEEISVIEMMREAERRHRDERLTSCVPVDFPWNPTPALLSGTQPKLAGRWVDGRLIVGLTAEERYIRWDMCEDLAQQLIRKTLEDAAKYPEHPREVTIRRMRRAIERKQWTERMETDWLMARLRVLLGW